jgi:hypothetical protein
MRLWILLFLCLPCAAFGAAWETVGPEMTVKTVAYSLRMDAATGAPLQLLLKGQPAVTFGPEGWWRLTMDGGQTLRASDCAARVTRAGDTLTVDYRAAKAGVTLTLRFSENAIAMYGTVRATDTAITRFALPPRLLFSPEHLHSAYFPIELGRALQPPFFRRQTDAALAGWKARSIGAEGARLVGVAPARGRDYNEPPVPVEVTDAGKEWLGPVAALLAGWNVRCPRAPEGMPDLTLLDTTSGPLLSLETVDGGWGRVVRWGGIFAGDDQGRVIRASARVAAELWRRPIAGGAKIAPPAELAGKPRRDVMPKKIGFIDLGDAPGAAIWREALTQSGLPVARISNPTELLASLKARDCWLIVNPYDELLPASEQGVAEMAAAIRSFVVNGGVWMHTGGYPFFKAIEATGFLQVSETYPPAFSDFLHLDLDSGQVSLYGVQSRDAVLTPASLSAGGEAAGGAISREWITWVKPGGVWSAPETRLHFGRPVQEAIRDYGAANRFDVSLEAKVKPAILPTLKRSLLLRLVGGNCAQMTAAVTLLPKPSLVHIAEYLHGGFDKQYPDHLPPRPEFGTGEEFAGFVDAIHAAGNLFMPYTNPTWWCDGPPGPTFVREGQAPLLKDKAGQPVREVYGRNYGWSLCAFHPAAIAAEKTILTQFTTQYPADVLFQDQVGARSPQYDFNPASPTPYAYIQGMIDIARRDHLAAPLGTENGSDAVLNDETLFCGITWGLVPTEGGPEWRHLWRDTYPADTWRFAPLALWLAHDKVMFAHHDLGQFVTNREVLAWTLALGYQMSLIESVSDLQNPQRVRWMNWIAALQRTFGPSVMGARLTAWDEPAPGVYRAVYGGVTVVANTTAKPWKADAATILSPYGFHITAPGTGAEAGWLDRYQGRDYPGNGHAFLRQGATVNEYAAGP